MESEQGFSLIEVLVAMTLLTVAVGGLAQLSVIATQANQRARIVSNASLLALQKMEQLRALAWRFDQHGVPVSDDSSDTTLMPTSPEGGTGLRPSPVTALTSNASGYCDYLDQSGRPLGGGLAGVAPARTSYIRRWSIEPLATDPDTFAIQVLVTTAGIGRPVESARLVSLRTRRGT